MTSEIDILRFPPPLGAEAPNDSTRIVIVASDTELHRLPHFQRLAIATGALTISRRHLPNLIADTLYSFRGTIVWPNGTPFELPDVDDAFGEDGSFRWISDFVRFAEEGPRQHPQQRILARLRLIDLYFRIMYPERARLIAK